VYLDLAQLRYIFNPKLKEFSNPVTVHAELTLTMLYTARQRQKNTETRLHRQGILWFGMEYEMEGKKRYGIWNDSSMQWKI